MKRLFIFGSNILNLELFPLNNHIDLAGYWPHLRAPAAIHCLPFWPVSEKFCELLRPAASEELSAGCLASLVASQSLKLYPEASQTDVIFHAQTTLSTNALASNCLKIANDVFPNCQETLTIGQCGSAGGAVAIALAICRLNDNSDQNCKMAFVSASDVWKSPFTPVLPGSFPFGDGAGGAIIGENHKNSYPQAEILGCEVIFNPESEGKGLSFGPSNMNFIVKNALVVCKKVIDRYGNSSISSVHGDPISEKTKSEFKIGIYNFVKSRPKMCFQEFQSTSATIFHSFHQAFQFCETLGKPAISLIWTSSPTGHAVAILIKSKPENRIKKTLKGVINE